MNREQTKHALKMKYGLPPNGPTDLELNQILADLRSLRAFGEAEIRTAVKQHCRGYDTHRYLSDSHADLVAALQSLLDEG